MVDQEFCLSYGLSLVHLHILMLVNIIVMFVMNGGYKLYGMTLKVRPVRDGDPWYTCRLCDRHFRWVGGKTK